MSGIRRPERGIRRALLAAATVVMFLALGPFASPLVPHEDSGVAPGTPIDHRNDVAVVQPGRTSTASLPSRLPPSRSLLLVVALVAGLVASTTPILRRRGDHAPDPDRPPLWSLPPHRGPPLLAAG